MFNKTLDFYDWGTQKDLRISDFVIVWYVHVAEYLLSFSLAFCKFRDAARWGRIPSLRAFGK